MLKIWKPAASVKSKWQFVWRGNDRHEYTLTANTIIQRTCDTCVCSDRAHTPSHPWAHASTEITQVLSCFVASVYSAGCVHHTTTGGEWRAWGRQCRGGWGEGVEGGGACWSWRVESICIWHTDCSKYANRQTMTFAVLFFLWYCSLSVKSTKRWACVLLPFACACARFIHLPGASIFLSRPPPQRATPMLHKSHERLALAANCSLKGNFDVWKWRWGVFERKAYRCISARGGEKTVACLMMGAFLTSDSSLWLPYV